MERYHGRLGKSWHEGRYLKQEEATTLRTRLSALVEAAFHYGCSIPCREPRPPSKHMLHVLCTCQWPGHSGSCCSEVNIFPPWFLIHRVAEACHGDSKTKGDGGTQNRLVSVLEGGHVSLRGAGDWHWLTCPTAWGCTAVLVTQHRQPTRSRWAVG